MDNILFEHDYTISPESEANRAIQRDLDIFDKAVATDFFKEYSDAMRKLPKIINPIRKANFEYAQNLCDDLAKRWHGKFRSEVRYDKWDAVIDVTLPFIEFGSPAELQNLAQIAQRVDSLTFSPADEGTVCMHAYALYFDDVASPEQINEIYEEILLRKPELLKALLLKLENEGEDVHEEYDKCFGND